MAKKASGIRVHVYGDYDDRDINKAIRDLNTMKRNAGQAQNQFGMMSKATRAAGVAIAGAAIGMGYAVSRFASDSIKAASDLEESQSKVTQVFKDQSDQVLSWAKTSATAFGMSKQQALEAAGTYGNLFQAFGLTSKAAQTMSTRMVELAADLASFNNTSIDDAIQALRSGLSGETEPLKRFGIALNDARLKSEAMALGIYEGSGALTVAQKSQAAYALILKDSTLAQGDFERTSDGLANTQRILTASVDDAKAMIGTSLLEAIQAVSEAMGGPNGLNNITIETARGVGDFLEIIPQIARVLGRQSDATDEASQEFVKYRNNMVRVDETSNKTARQIVGLIPVIGVFGEVFLVNAEKQNIAAQAAIDNANAQKALEAGYRRASTSAKENTNLLIQQIDAINAWESATGMQIFQIKAANKHYQDAAYRAHKKAEADKEAADKADDLAGASIRAGSAVDSLGERMKSARQIAVNAISAMREELKAKLDEARADFNNYAQQVSQSITGAISFREAAPEFDEAGNRVGMSFIEALTAQAEKAKQFAAKIKQLISMDLSQDALQQVLAAGVEAGTNIANELIDGGATAINETNRLVEETQTAADEVGLQAAESFFGAGVTTAEQTLEGFRSQFGKDGPARAKLMDLMDRLAEKAARQVKIEVAVTRRVNEVVTRVIETISSPQARAMGGPVKAGSPYLIGERGPELFVPDISGTVISNADLRGGGGSVVAGGVTINVNAGMGTDGRQVGRQIVEALKQYERANGSVPIKVS